MCFNLLVLLFYVTPCLAVAAQSCMQQIPKVFTVLSCCWCCLCSSCTLLKIVNHFLSNKKSLGIALACTIFFSFFFFSPFYLLYLYIFTMNSQMLVFTKNIFKTKFLTIRYIFFTMIWHNKAWRHWLLSVGLRCKKSVLIQSFSGPYFPAFGLDTDRYSLSLRIQVEYGKIPTRKTPNTNTIHALLSSKYVCFSSLKEHEDLENL